MIPSYPLTPCQYPIRRLGWREKNGEGGFPHSEIVGSKIAHISPTLIAACHVLHRLCMPRHPPIALTSRLRIHTTNDNSGTRSSLRRRARPHGLAGHGWPPVAAAPLAGNGHSTQLDNHCCVQRMLLPSAGRSRRAEETHAATASISRTHSQCQRGPFGPAIRGRSRETGVFIPGNLVEPIGIEPMT